LADDTLTDPEIVTVETGEVELAEDDEMLVDPVTVGAVEVPEDDPVLVEPLKLPRDKVQAA
jgi:allophanate hydrolase subunit 2